MMMTKVRVWNISLFVVNFHPIKLSQLHWNGNKSDTDASSVMMMMMRMMMMMMMMRMMIMIMMMRRRRMMVMMRMMMMTYLDIQTIQAPPAGRSQSWGW